MNVRRTNRDAVTATLRVLQEAGKLKPEHAALVTVCGKLASAVDANPDNASLWREFRGAVAELSRVGADDAGDTDGAAAFAAAVSAAALGDAAVS